MKQVAEITTNLQMMFGLLCRNQVAVLIMLTIIILILRIITITKKVLVVQIIGISLIIMLQDGEIRTTTTKVVELLLGVTPVVNLMLNLLVVEVVVNNKEVTIIIL